MRRASETCRTATQQKLTHTSPLTTGRLCSAPNLRRSQGRATRPSNESGILTRQPTSKSPRYPALCTMPKLALTRRPQIAVLHFYRQFKTSCPQTAFLHQLGNSLVQMDSTSKTHSALPANLVPGNRPHSFSTTLRAHLQRTCVLRIKALSEQVNYPRDRMHLPHVIQSKTTNTAELREILASLSTT